MIELFRKYREEIFVGFYTGAYPTGNWDRQAWTLRTNNVICVNNLKSLCTRFLKRSFDVVTATILLVGIFSWLFPVVALLIKLDSRGPVFFIQKRTGLNRKSFNIIKFRTLYVNEEANRQRVKEGDNRITRIGFYLRKYFIDEVPQLINVLKGDMSMVGPRPLMLWDNVRDARLIEYYHDRHKVKPGLTGLAQIRGHHGHMTNYRDLLNRFYSDIEYIENWSWFRDLIIIFGTFIHIIKNT